MHIDSFKIVHDDKYRYERICVRFMKHTNTLEENFKASIKKKIPGFISELSMIKKMRMKE